MSLVLLFLPQAEQGGVESASASVAAEAAVAFAGAAIAASSVTSRAESVATLAGASIATTDLSMAADALLNVEGASIAAGVINGEAVSEAAFHAESPAVIKSGDFAFGGASMLAFQGACLEPAAEEVSRPAWWYRRQKALREQAALKRRSAHPKSRTSLSRYT